MLITFPLYILRELGKYFGMSLLIYAFVFLAMYCGMMLREGATFLTTLRLLPLVFPLITPLALPLAVITGILICYGRLSSNNEFVGSQAGGIHPGWVALPALSVAFLASLITVYLNADLLTSAVNSIERSLLKDKATILRAKLTRAGSFTLPISRDQSIAMYRLNESWTGGTSGIDFTRFKKLENGEKADENIWDPAYPFPEQRIIAKEHFFDVNEDEDGNMDIIATFSDPYQYSSTGSSTITLDSSRLVLTFEVPKTGLNMSISKDRTQYMGIDRLKQQMTLADENIANLRKSRLEFAGNAIDALLKSLSTTVSNEQFMALQQERNDAMSGDSQKRRDFINSLLAVAQNKSIEIPAQVSNNIDDFSQMNTRIHNAEDDRLRFVAEINNKLVMSFACISFAIIGIPLALMLRRGGSMIGFVIGLSFAFAFYMVLTALNGLVRDGSIAWWGLWVPNIFVLFAGIILWHYSQKELR